MGAPVDEVAQRVLWSKMEPKVPKMGGVSPSFRKTLFSLFLVPAGLDIEGLCAMVPLREESRLGFSFRSVSLGGCLDPSLPMVDGAHGILDGTHPTLPGHKGVLHHHRWC